MLEDEILTLAYIFESGADSKSILHDPGSSLT